MATPSFWGFISSVSISKDCKIISSEWCSKCIDINTVLNAEPFKLKRPDNDYNNMMGTDVAGIVKRASNESLNAATDNYLKSSQPQSNIGTTASSSSTTTTATTANSTTSNTPNTNNALSMSKHSYKKKADSIPVSMKVSKCSALSLLPYSIYGSKNPSAHPSHHDDPHISHSTSRTQSDKLASNFMPPMPLNSAFNKHSLVAKEPLNQELVDIFYDLMITRRLEGEEFSSMAYERPLKAIQAANKPIMGKLDAQKLLKITSRMAALIQDIRSGKVTRSLTRPGRQKAEALSSFATVYGIGPYNARKLYDQGFRTLEDIKSHVDENGKVFIEHHQDFVERMSRKEVEEHYEAVKKIAKEIDPDLELKCMGSYRRGMLDCGDIDIILTKQGTLLRDLKKYRKQLVALMFDKGLAVHTFTKGSDRWLGATQTRSKWRRMDILLVPWDELGAAMIYYTGNDVFNRRIRRKAKRHGMTLNQTGLFKVSGSGEKKLLEAHSERRIFKLLEEPWLEAEQRNL